MVDWKFAIVILNKCMRYNKLQSGICKMNNTNRMNKNWNKHGSVILYLAESQWLDMHDPYDRKPVRYIIFNKPISSRWSG